MEGRIGSLKVALNNEKKEREFYLAQAKRTKNAVGKAMFLQIASEEEEHYNLLKELYDKWQVDEQWPADLPLTVNGTTVTQILSEVVKKAKKDRAAGDKDDLAALKTAIEFEAAGAKFYRQLRDAVVDRKEKAFFDLLARVEHDHFLSLKDTEEYLSDPSSWYRKVEGASLDGA